MIKKHFQTEDYQRQTLYDYIIRLQHRGTIKDQTSKETSRKNQLKRLTNNRKGVSQSVMS